uniref:Uncharacterized protein n=1 Tax=Rhizophora mucronata TaxID=61149 RepID=A0A2P2PT55_RHIMU
MGFVFNFGLLKIFAYLDRRLGHVN